MWPSPVHHKYYAGLENEDLAKAVVERSFNRRPISGFNSPGVEFIPTDYELITCYLHPKIAGELVLKFNFFHDFNMYSTEPSTFAS